MYVCVCVCVCVCLFVYSRARYVLCILARMYERKGRKENESDWENSTRKHTCSQMLPRHIGHELHFSCVTREAQPRLGLFHVPVRLDERGQGRATREPGLAGLL